jgi:hypothetical protein
MRGKARILCGRHHALFQREVSPRKAAQFAQDTNDPILIPTRNCGVKLIDETFDLTMIDVKEPDAHDGIASIAGCAHLFHLKGFF